MEKRKLKELGKVVSGTTPKTNIKEYWNGNFLWITPAEIKEDDYYISDTQRKITDLGVKKTNLRLLPKGTVLLSSRAPIGKVAICGKDMYCNQGFKSIICSKKLLNRYLYYFLKYNVEQIKLLGRGATFKEISKEIVEELQIPMRDMKEQIEISNKLDKITEIIYLRRKQIEGLKKLIKSKFVEMFINKNFKKVRINDVVKYILAGGDKPNDISKIKNEKYKYPVYANGCENDGLQGYAKEYKVNERAITVAARGTIGFSIIREAKFTPIVRLITIAPNEKIDLIYLKYAIDQINFSISGTSQAQLTVPSFKNELIVLPPIELQNQFTELVKQINKQQIMIEKSLEETEKLRESLMNKYFG